MSAGSLELPIRESGFCLHLAPHTLPPSSLNSSMAWNQAPNCTRLQVVLMCSLLEELHLPNYFDFLKQREGQEGLGWGCLGI